MADPSLEVISVEDIPPNSFVLLKVDVPGPMEKYNAAKELAQSLATFYSEFRKKNISFLILTPKEDISVLTEAEMNLAGWYRKEK